MSADVVVQGELTRVELEGAVATLRLDRPPVNALNLAMQEEILAAARWLARSEQARAVVIYGGPKMFAAGADIKEMAAMTYQDMASASHLLQESFNAVAGLPMPVVAAVTGFALGGGCELALCADLRVVGERAKLGQPEVLLGVIPGLGGSQRLPRLIGPSRAKDMILTGRYVGARRPRSSAWPIGSSPTMRCTTRRWPWPSSSPPARRWPWLPPSARSTRAWRWTSPPGARSSGWSSPGSSPRTTGGSGWSRSWPTVPGRRASPAAEPGAGPWGSPTFAPVGRT